MDKETLSNYGWIVICVLVLSVLIALATPFGSFVSNAVQNTTEGLFKAEQNATEEGLKAADVELQDVEFGDVATVGGSNNSIYGKNDPALNHSGVIPEGGTYTLANGTVLSAGETFPETPQYLDAYRYGDYTYVYSASYSSEPYTASFYNQFSNGDYNGWLVTVRNENGDSTANGWGYYYYQLIKSTYGTILEHIADKPVISMNCTFFSFYHLTVSPKIPSTVTDMSSTFYMTSCEYRTSQLTTAPTIPSSVDILYDTFSNCCSLTGVIEINANPSRYGSMLEDYFYEMDNQKSKDIILTGTSSMLQEIANTSTTGCRTVYDINGNILKQ